MFEQKINNSIRPVYDFLKRHAGRDAVSFHMPGHKGSAIYRRFGYDDFLAKMMDCDITEIYGADNLFQTEGIIREVQDRYASLYGVQSSYLLVNGSSGGIIASILSAVRPGGRLIMARNCHKAVFHALRLGRIQPAFVYPSLVDDFGIAGPMEPEVIKESLLRYPDAEAVIVTSPNYYGICSDIRSIATLVHQAGKILIVDEAHGAHLKFSDRFPESAVDAGADLVIHSIHKTLASFTQSSVLHRCSGLVQDAVLMEQLAAMQTTSPSYLLMASLDISESIMEEHGPELMKEWIDNLDLFYQRGQSIQGLKLLKGISLHDPTKINLSMEALGLSGSQLQQLLREEYGIDMELSAGDMVMAMTGIGNQRKDYDRLVNALEAISESKSRGIKVAYVSTHAQVVPSNTPSISDGLDPVLESLGNSKLCNLEECVGKISAALVTPYPPGIPLLCTGERITGDAVAELQQLRKQDHKILGIRETGQILVFDENKGEQQV